MSAALRARLAPWQFTAIYSPVDHLAMYGGVAVGKTFTGAHFAIQMMRSRPDLTGFVGANTYDQLSQVTLRELFYWLTKYRIPYVIDRRPPKEWGETIVLKDYNNVLSVQIVKGGKTYVVTVFTRVLSDGDPLRGLEFSWYWLDETRDTPENTHNIILSRLREDEFVRGRITTTTNGQDWSYNRFVKGGDGRMYASMHVPTKKSLELGIINQKYYDTMLRSYSPLLALQELEAKHVNVLGGRAYYAASDLNRCPVAPWGAAHPSTDRPLIIGCDFNFSPAPCIWMIGQEGPNLSGPNGEFWGDYIHWFDEIAESETSTRSMAKIVLSRYPGFFYKVFGDHSGQVGTTSNAGEHDYFQIGEEFLEAGAFYSVDADQGNPLVRDRVENMNAQFCNGLGERHMSWNPQACPNFDEDVNIVGWKQNTISGRGKLDDGGDKKRTHATDGAGYAIWKLRPPGTRGMLVGNPQSPFASTIESVVGR